MRHGWLLGFGACFGLGLGRSSPAAEPKPLPRFERIVIDDDFPSGYQVEVADVNGDGKADLVGVGGSTCAWYENPSWKKRIITDASRTPGIISSATADLDGDGKAEVAIAYEFEMNQPTQGKLALVSQGAGPDDPWEFRPLADVPSIHRLRWGNIDGDGRRELVVASLFGPKALPPEFDQDRADLQVARLVEARRWEPTLLGKMPILHAIEVIDLDGDGRAEILTASRNGVGRFARVPPIEALLPTILAQAENGQGASEVHAGPPGRRTTPAGDHRALAREPSRRPELQRPRLTPFRPADRPGRHPRRRPRPLGRRRGRRRRRRDLRRPPRQGRKGLGL